MNAHSGKSGEKLQLEGNTGTADKSKMPPKRHAEIMSRAVAARQGEAWISEQPHLSFAYASQYMPTLFEHINSLFSHFRIRAFKQGSEAMQFSSIFNALKGKVTDKKQS